MRKILFAVLLFTTLLAIGARPQDQGGPPNPSAAPPPPPPPPPPMPSAPPASHPHVIRIRVGGNVQQRKIIHSVPPTYPADAISQRISGNVVLHVIVAKDGLVQKIEVVSGPDKLRQSAVDAVKQWRYKPTLLNGELVEVDTTVQVNFTLQ